MSCTTTGVTIIGDENNSLLDSVNFVAGTDSTKQTILAGYINNPEFGQYVKDNTGIEELLNVNPNTLRKLLKSFYISNTLSVDNSINKKMAASIGNFSSATALSRAKDHTANLISEHYYAELSKDKKERKSNLDIINDVTKEINRTFINDIARPLMLTALSDKYNTKGKKLAKQAKEADDAFNANADESDRLLDRLDELEDNEENADEIDRINDRLDELDEEINKLASDRYVKFFNLVQEIGNIRQKNYANLVGKVRGDRNNWFNSVFAISKLTSISNSFEELLKSDKLDEPISIDESDTINPDHNDGTNTMTKRWDGDNKDFLQYISSDVKLYFNSIYQLSSPIADENGRYDYDTNNELGVPMTMGANFIITQITSFASFDSLNDFITSIERKSKSIKDLYGLKQLVDKMKADRVFANRIYCQLANPKVIKTMAVISESGIDFSQSNKSIEPMGYMLFNLINQAKFTMNDAFTIDDSIEIQRLISNINRERSNNLFYNSPIKESADKHILSIFTAYFPKLNRQDILNYLNSNKEDYKGTYIAVLQNLNEFLTTVNTTILEQNKVKEENDKAYVAWKRGGENGPRPIYDSNKVNFDRLNSPLINLAQKLINFVPVKNELNSTNAEGNLSSDIGDNNYISNLMKQIAYGTEEDANAGLNKLKDFITQGHQYDYSTIFYGVKDSEGNTLVPGLFEKTDSGVTINPNAKDIITVSLFNGAKDSNNTKAALYTGMSRADYFLTQLVAFHSPVNYVRKTSGNINMAGYFLHTPSDAPKNYVAQMPRMSYDNLWQSNEAANNDYIREAVDNINKRLNSTNTGEFAERTDSIILSLKKNNYVDAKTLYSIISNGSLETLAYNNTYAKYNKETNRVQIPLVYRNNEQNLVTVWLEGDKSLDSMSNIAENLEIVAVVTPMQGLPKGFVNAVKSDIVFDGIKEGKIVRNINHNNPIARAAYTNLYGELNNFIENLNNVFEKNNKGEWVLKKDTKHLIDRYHLNGGKLVTEVTDENGNKHYELSGNVFGFTRLFETNKYSTNDKLKAMLSLYRGTSESQVQPLIASTESGNMSINLGRNDLIIEVDGRLKLNISSENKDILNQAVEGWIHNYEVEINQKSKDYSSVIGESFTPTQINEFAFNACLAEMAFYDLFEGDAKFYKDAQTFLKRAKEIQAGGKAYASQNMNDAIGGQLTDILDMNGAVVPITIKGEQIKLPRRGNTVINPDGILTERNGFRAVTIVNTVKPSVNAKRIYDEIYNYYKDKLGDMKAVRIASEISKGYFENSKVNDAQSYITFEEFIARKHADGTLHEYEDLIQQIFDVRNGLKTISDIDLAGINSRIQVQKNFYFDQQFDPITQTYYSRQIKNAEFVLIPELLPNDTELKNLYEIMRRNDIGQVNTEETSKAANKNVLTYWDNNENVNPNFEKDINGVGENVSDPAYNDDVVETYYYRYLYKQQDVSEHMKDSVNKAGIQILKKIIDNANTASQEVRDNVNKFFKNYAANIKEDFTILLNRMGWHVVNGELQNINGNNTTNLDFTEFYRQARIEAQRLGMDSNFIDYLTPDELGNPTMKNYMNNVSEKLESIAQAIFNSAITRQKLPGWHAAQITNVGKSEKLQYHPEIVDEKGNVTQAAYMEVLIPRWSNLLPKDFDLSKMEEGIMLQMAYRIPTEGKQSISNIKVVGFLDDVYGSTIVVPNDWVAQTGSDFDVDSVYGIAPEIYKDRDGVIRKIKADLDTSIEGVQRRYIKYVNSNLKERVPREVITEEFVSNKVQELYSSIVEPETKLRESKAFKELIDKEAKAFKALKKVSYEASTIVMNANKNTDGHLADKLEASSAAIEAYGAELTDDNLKELCYELADIQDAIIDLLRDGQDRYQNALTKFRSSKPNEIKAIYDKAKQDYFEKIKKVAKEGGVESFEEFSKRTIEEQQSRRARNNEILDAMMDIMNDPSSREENYSRSNFDDINKVNKEMRNLTGASKIPRSSNNVFDQIDFMQNAMSGAMLKAFSVARDTFNSVANYTKAELSETHAIPIVYDLFEYNEKTLIDAYGKNVVIDRAANTATITHKQFAWSINNRNVRGKLITPYSSQTTAHILDSIKEGAIPNENQYTFGTFKTLIDVGTDYETAIAFLMQPGVNEIVKAHNEINSIYIKDSGNPIRNSVKAMANKMGLKLYGKPITNYSSYSEVLNTINGNPKIQAAFKELFSADISTKQSFMEQVYALNENMLRKRLANEPLLNNSELSSEDKAILDMAFDLAMISTFNKVHNTTLNIEKLVRCSNPDKFGAKQTVRATRKVIENIDEYSKEKDTNTTGNTLQIEGKPFLAKLYPKDEKGDIDVNASPYMYLASFLKYATIPSVNANKKLFATESDAFNKVVKTVESRLGRELTDEEYREYKKYMVSNVYAAVTFFTNPQTVNDRGYITENFDLSIKQAETDTFYWNTERARIFGYDKTESSNLTVKNINSPKGDEIQAFNLLTPAQKVVWIQQHFPDGKGIFGNLNVNAFNQFEFKTKGFSSSTIRFSDQVDNPEEMLIAFKESFFNKNPLVRLAAIDLIKYAFIVEGFNFKKGGISKIIANEALFGRIEHKGTNLMSAIDETFNKYNNINESRTSEFIDKFVRSHSDIVLEVKIPRDNARDLNSKRIGALFKTTIQREKILFVPNAPEYNGLAEHLGLNKSVELNYTRITKYNAETNKWVTTLYKIEKGKAGTYFMPLNLLERNETSDYSVNKNNNKFQALKYYKDIVDEANRNNVSVNALLNDQQYKELLDNKNYYTIKPHQSNNIIEAVENPNELVRLSEQGNSFQKAAINKFISDIGEYLSSPVEERTASILIRNDNATLTNAIPKGIEIIQAVPVGEETKLVRIQRVEPSANFKNIVKGNQKGDWAKVEDKEVKALQNSIDAQAVNPILYEVTELHKEDQEVKSYAITPIIDMQMDKAFSPNNYDSVAKAIANEITSRSFRENNPAADKFKKRMDIKGVDTNNYESISKNRKSIYTSAAAYYAVKSRELLDNLTKYKTLSGETFALNDKNLYKYLIEHPEEVDAVTKIILDAKTFGDQFYPIFNLNIKGEDNETNRAIDSIRTSLNNVRTSDVLSGAIELMFDNYMANVYSTNPLIRHGIMTLRQQFGDTDWFDLNLSDVGELNNTQVQTVVKSVYTIINAAKLRGIESADAFLEGYDKILGKGNIRMDVVIDKQGRIIRPYTDDFVKDREKYDNEVYEAEAKGINSVEHLWAKLKRNEWRARNVQQEVVTKYYDDLNALTRTILSAAPEEYSKYVQITTELYSDNRAMSLLSEEEKEYRKRLKYQLNDLLSEMSNGNLKSDNERFKIAQLRNFIKAKKALNKEYFNYDEGEGFESTLNSYLKYMQDYKDRNPYGTLEDFIKDDKYREAYEWIQSNSVYKLSDEANELLNNAFKTLSDRDNVRSAKIRELLKDADAYDAYGNIDPRKLTPQQIKMVRNLTMSKYAKDYDSNAGEAILIKDVPKGQPVFKDELYRKLRGEGETVQNPRRLEIIHEINELISKGVDGSGRIKTDLLFKKLTENELIRLGDLYVELHNIKSNRTKAQVEQLKNNIEFKTEDIRFAEEYADAQRDLNSTQFDIWTKIFIQTDKDGNLQRDEDGKYIPNNDIYGYMIPKDESMINKEKTAARDLIENAVEYVPTEYYYAARNEALKNGTYDEWFAANHVFNPFTRKQEPLKIWTKMEVVPGSQLGSGYEYVPTNDHLDRTVKDEYVNENYIPNTHNYNEKTGDYKNPVSLTENEIEMAKYLQSIMNTYSSTHSMKQFARKGYIPRRAKFQPDNTWYLRQIPAMAGLETRNTGETKYHDEISYTHDFDADFDMTTLIKGKGYQELEKIIPRGTTEDEAAYRKRVQETKERNRKREEENLAIDNALLDRDYRSVFADFVEQATVYNARQKAKNSIYLLLEDLKNNDAYAISRYTGKLKVDKKLSTSDKLEYQKVKQRNTYDVFENWARRVIFKEFKKDSKMAKYADLLQNMTSAKYMILNITGGVANVFTGLSNIYAEVFAKEYFDSGDWNKAQAQYFANSLSMISDMYSDTSSNLTVAITKLFNVVDFDAFTERRPNENATEYVRRVRDGLYALQSGGEHYMQNAALLACLKSHRVFKDFDGTVRAGSFANYTWKTEYNTMINLLTAEDDSLRIKYFSFIDSIQHNLEELRAYGSFAKDFNEEFLRDIGDKKLIKKYIAARDKALVEAKKEFKILPTVESQFELKDGRARIKEGSELTKEKFAELQQKVISINKKIHGVYDKDGAARIEREWWGGLVMQYHKHIYPGIMKRWRVKGYYNELRSSIEKGSYISLANFLGTEFNNFKSKVNNKVESDNSNKALASIQVALKSTIDTIINLKMNWELMPPWERNNVRRTFGDLLGIGSAFLMAIAIHVMTDDDELKEDNGLSTLLYLADRLNSESSMYTPWGLISEASTLWSSPIAGTNAPEDLLKAFGIAINYLFDDDYNINYSTGLYNKENRLWVLLRRNIPAYRVYDRINHMSRNNQYYRINDNALNIKTAKNIADSINPD